LDSVAVDIAVRESEGDAAVNIDNENLLKIP
jgi:hypothetical protein